MTFIINRDGVLLQKDLGKPLRVPHHGRKIVFGIVALVQYARRSRP
jgi:hypothetical protein